MKTTAAKIGTSATTALLPAFLIATVLAVFWMVTENSPSPPIVWGVVFGLVFLGYTLYNFRGWACRACGAQGMWSDAKISNLSESYLCNHCNEYLE